jgi:hydrogenase nickel incorporation protein HypA/HybF
MHEFALVQKIIDLCVRIALKNHAQKIQEINLDVGDFSLVIDTMLQHCFEIARLDSIAAEAQLIIKHVPGEIRCETCGKVSEIWFNLEKTSDEAETQTTLENYEKTISAEDALKGSPDFGRNLFKCRQCGSRETELISGKGILIKNIRV